jgi:hypothetical protein
MLVTFTAVAYLAPFAPFLCLLTLANGFAPKLSLAVLAIYLSEAALPLPQDSRAVWPAACRLFRWPLFQSWKVSHQRRQRRRIDIF